MDSFWINIAPLIVAVTALIVVLGKWYLDYRAAKVIEKKEKAGADITAAKLMEEIAVSKLQDIKNELNELRTTLKTERADSAVKLAAATAEIAALTAEVKSLKHQLMTETGELSRKVEAQQIRILALETELKMIQRKDTPA